MSYICSYNIIKEGYNILANSVDLPSLNCLIILHLSLHLVVILVTLSLDMYWILYFVFELFAPSSSSSMHMFCSEYTLLLQL